MNLRIVFKFKDCKLQFYEKRRLFCYFSVNPCTPASRWRRLLKLKRKKINSFKIIIGFFFTPTLFLSTYRHFVCLLLAKKYQMHSKAQNRKKVYRNRPIERASQCHSPHHICNLLLRMRAIHEIKSIKSTHVCGLQYFQRGTYHSCPTLYVLFVSTC